MSLHRKRFTLALERIQPTDWARFEQFASAFLTSEFDNLRTVASPSGDEGRDAELFSPTSEPEIVLQYSVTKHWTTKIRDTAKKVKKNLTHARQLLYVTNQQIGADGDGLKKELRTKYQLILDIRDSSFFLDRYEGDDHREAVAENLARDIVDPFLESKDVIQKKAQALTTAESRAALVFLELQWQDDGREKGLTKTAFDALVRTALRGTNPDYRLTRNQVYDLVKKIIPTDDIAFLIAETDKSLSRLNKNFIRHYPNDEFCLSHEENIRLKSRIAEVEINDQELVNDITNALKAVIPEVELADNGNLLSYLSICRISMEKFLLQRGELFVSALENGQLQHLEYGSVKRIVQDELKIPNINEEQLTNRLATVIERVLTDPSISTASYLRGIADAYTFLAFLRQTPDIQSAVKKMFSTGEIWIDTSIVLPLLAEDLLPEENWQFRKLILAAKNAGLKIKVTPGVIEEVERHINRSQTCYGLVNSGQESWDGSYPYLFSFFISTGSAQSFFSKWLENFRGNIRPEDDVSEYLKHFFSIEMTDISIDAQKADLEIRNLVKETWVNIHTNRRNRSNNGFDPLLSLRLAEHDTENYLGVIVRRQHESEKAFGYTSWWLTLDHKAFEIKPMIEQSSKIKIPLAPVMSADFLANYLAFGPLRGKVAKNMHGALPVAIDPGLVEYLSPELLEIAKSVRLSAKDKPEHVIRRDVRDALDNARRRQGDITNKGLNSVFDS
ncbi:hypothetical protein [Methylomonas rivi]|uniref:Uncharacterized protein n=1 Tax=Methylomonas rivi TaxID=2952226 RepID=A0ABT1U3N3_9GAMM|nr:hypothetical protein [Methylomonas sp. WSC-6]MCQ8128453.1 hypothetical protein [Methylomonas sp. WSC-6]